MNGVNIQIVSSGIQYSLLSLCFLFLCVCCAGMWHPVFSFMWGFQCKYVGWTPLQGTHWRKQREEVIIWGGKGNLRSRELPEALYTSRSAHCQGSDQGRSRWSPLPPWSGSSWSPPWRISPGPLLSKLSLWSLPWAPWVPCGGIVNGTPSWFTKTHCSGFTFADWAAFCYMLVACCSPNCISAW